MSTLHSPDYENQMKFSVILRIPILWGGSYPSARDPVSIFLVPPTGWWIYPGNKVKSKVGNCSQGRPEGSLFNSYYTKAYRRALLLSLDCSTLPLIHTLYCWVLSKEVSSTIFKVFGMTRPGIEPRSPGPLANTQPTRPMSWESR